MTKRVPIGKRFGSWPDTRTHANLMTHDTVEFEPPTLARIMHPGRAVCVTARYRRDDLCELLWMGIYCVAAA
jgi:hypothetical protein